MRIEIAPGVRLFVDVEGLGLVPDADVLGIVRQYLRDHPQAVKVPLRAGFGT